MKEGRKSLGVGSGASTDAVGKCKEGELVIDFVCMFLLLLVGSVTDAPHCAGEEFTGPRTFGPNSSRKAADEDRESSRVSA